MHDLFLTKRDLRTFVVILSVKVGVVGVGASALTLGGGRISHVSAGGATAVDVVLAGLERIRLAPLETKTKFVVL